MLTIRFIAGVVISLMVETTCVQAGEMNFTSGYDRNKNEYTNFINFHCQQEKTQGPRENRKRRSVGVYEKAQKLICSFIFSK